MTCKQLIEKLKEFPEDAIVICPEEDMAMSVVPVGYVDYDADSKKVYISGI